MVAKVRNSDTPRPPLNNGQISFYRLLGCKSYSLYSNRLILPQWSLHPRARIGSCVLKKKNGYESKNETFKIAGYSMKMSRKAKTKVIVCSCMGNLKMAPRKFRPRIITALPMPRNEWPKMGPPTSNIHLSPCANIKYYNVKLESGCNIPVRWPNHVGSKYKNK